MAGSARFTALLDANVLYPQLIRDTLLSLAVERLYHARWSAPPFMQNGLATWPETGQNSPPSYLWSSNA